MALLDDPADGPRPIPSMAMAASSEVPNPTADGSGGSPAGGADGPPTALAPVWARALAFVAIIVGGLAGALVGSRFGEVACTGSCDGPIAASMLVGATVAALGVAAVAVITLRVAGEWVGGS